MATPKRNPRARLAYEFIKAHRRAYPIEVMCRTLHVAPSGYYEWLQKPISDRALEDARLLRLIRALLQGESRHIRSSADIFGSAGNR